MQGGLKADDEMPNFPVQEVEKPVEDDWKEPVPKPAPVPPAKPKVDQNPETIGDEDPWVEDLEGNFVRQSELTPEPAKAPPKPKQQATPTKKHK